MRGGEIDRIVDVAHASVGAAIAELLVGLGWAVRVEVTYAVGSERRSIDLLAFHPVTRALLVVEIKVDVTSAELTLRRRDEKVRLGRQVARDRFQWEATSVSRLLVLPDASTPRRRIPAHAAPFDRVYPLRGRGVRRGLRHPDGAFAGLLFLSVTKPAGGRSVLESRRRVQRPRGDISEYESKPVRERPLPRFIDSTGEHQLDW